LLYKPFTFLLLAQNKSNKRKGRHENQLKKSLLILQTERC
jgi:hypothetical protein